MKKNTHTDRLSSRPPNGWDQVDDPGFDPEEKAEYEGRKSIEKAYDLETVERYLRLVWHLGGEGRIAAGVLSLTSNVVATARCAVEFPEIKCNGACYLIGQAKPENYEAL